MLSRLRMSVEDGINEYKRLGGEVFGSPRPLPNKGIVWHKFSSKRLQRVIEEVVQNNSDGREANQLSLTYPSPEDLCRT